MNRRLKRPVVYGLYAIGICMLIGGIVLLETSSKKFDSKKVTINMYQKQG